jgi:GNAT superfamily N-acetyltransferase
MNPPFRLVVETAPALADLALLEDEVARAAAAVAGVGVEQDLAVFVRDDDGTVLAGISGMTWGGYCELYAMWVHETIRGHGLARQLLAAAEEEARRRGCGFVLFHAYDVLTSGLYTRLGYDTVGVVQDCPAGSAARWYRKEL